MWKQTTKIERNLKIFKEELDDFLPSKILDFHVHICSKDAVPDGINYALSMLPAINFQNTGWMN